jgi:PAS domain S-box-containing protein
MKGIALRMLKVLELPNKTRKQLLDELEAAQTRIQELEANKDAWARVEPNQPAGETHFARLFRDSRITNLLFDAEGNLLSANVDALNKLGLVEYQSALRKSLFQSSIWTPDVRARLAAGEVVRLHLTLEIGAAPVPGKFGRAIEGTDVAADKLTPTPSIAHLESTISALGESAYLVQVHDVTTEVQSKAALKEREVFFRSVFQAIPYPTAVWRHVGEDRFTLYFYNSSADVATHGRLKAFDGMDLDEFYSHAPDFAQRVKQAFRTGEPVVEEKAYTFRTTGAQHYVRITSAKVSSEYVIDTVTDLTELKQAQAELAENEARFRRLLDNAPDVIYRLALKPEIRYEYISPAAAAVTGYTPEELMSDLTFAGTRIDPQDRRDPPATIDDLPERGEPQLLRWLRKDGRLIWLEHRFVVVRDEQGEPEAIEGISREVTAQVEARRVLERSLNEKEMLLQEVHHRVKNNLAILSSLLELQAVTLVDPGMREIVRDTQSRILSVASVHEALYQTGDAGGIDLGEYVSRLTTELREAYVGERGIEVEYDLDRYVVSQHRAIHFGLMVNELISNAFKHAFPASLERRGRVRLTLRESGDALRLLVEDNGVGLPEDFIVDNSDSLGMQVVAMLADQMNGEIAYASTPGNGTRAQVFIPKRELENGH